MTSPSRKKHQTTRRSTAAPTPPSGGVAAAYAAVDRTTRPNHTGLLGPVEPLWLPAGWLAIVLLLTAAAPSLGAPATADGWRARGSAKATHGIASRPASPTRNFRPTASRPVKQVAWHDDLAGPALRIAQRDELFDSFERPFGADASADPSGIERPADETRFDPSSDADTADSLFNDDLPPEPQELPGEDTFREEDTADAGSLFDEPGETEEVSPGDPMQDERFEAEPIDQERLQRERDESQRDCQTALEDLRNNRLAEIDLSIHLAGTEGEDFPFECQLNTGEVLAPRCWAEITYTWKASALCHKPLYFEDVHLERYGHSWGPIAQPLVSGAHFFGRLPIVPYMMGLKAPNECVYTLGHYRPGDCAPYLIDPIPFTWRAALYQTGGVFGVAGFLP